METLWIERESPTPMCFYRQFARITEGHPAPWPPPHTRELALDHLNCSLPPSTASMAGEGVMSVTDRSYISVALYICAYEKYGKCGSKLAASSTHTGGMTGSYNFLLQSAGTSTVVRECCSPSVQPPDHRPSCLEEVWRDELGFNALTGRFLLPSWVCFQNFQPETCLDWSAKGR